jgi:hypothetical protein
LLQGDDPAPTCHQVVEIIRGEIAMIRQRLCAALPKPMQATLDAA